MPEDQTHSLRAINPAGLPDSVPRMSHKASLPPGSIVHVGSLPKQAATVTGLRYGADFLQEINWNSIENTWDPDAGLGVSWIRVRGVHDTNLVREIGQRFGLHPLVLEDVTNTTERPKLDDYGSYLFVVLKDLKLDGKGISIHSEQISLILGRGYLISFHEGEDDGFGQLADRIEHGQGRLRVAGPDYLAYALIDTVVDRLFEVEEGLTDLLAEVDEQVLSGPGKETLPTLYKLMRVDIALRKSLLPMREVIGALERRDSDLLKESTAPFLKDVADHMDHVMEGLETLGKTISGLLSLYHSSAGYRLNEIIKILTIVATVFMPLTFLAGLYGMNFKHMPELDYRWGYPIVVGLMASIATGMLLIFHRKGWL